MANCIICGDEFAPRHKAHVKCAKCAKLTRRQCKVCGKDFIVGNNSPATMCSKECRSIHLSEVRTGKTTQWSEEKRAARRAEKANDPEWAEMQRKGTAAAKASPIAGPFETNQNAKIWHLVSPEGEHYEAHNLNYFFRTHPELIPGNTPHQAASGIRQIHASMRGKRDDVPEWKGWQLLKVELPTYGECAYCGKPITRPNAKYCSRTCANRGRPAMQIDKTCLTCGKAFVATSGRTKYCSPECRPSLHLTEDQKERSRKAALAYYYNNRDKAIKRINEYALANKEKLKVAAQERYKKNKEIRDAYNKQYRESHAEEIAANKVRYYNDKKDKFQDYNRAYYEANKEKILARKREYIARKKAEAALEAERESVGTESKPDGK